MGIKSRIFVGLAKTGFNLRFFIARMTHIEPIGKFIEKSFFDEDRMIYLPKDCVAEKALTKTVTVNINKSFAQESVVLPSQIVEHLIRNSRYHFLMNFCLCREANHCNNYPKEYGCLFLGKGAMRIDRKFGRPVSADEAINHIRKCREAGLVHLIGRNKIDAVVFDTGRKEELLSICSCCPCCCLWKMLPDLNAEISSAVTRMSGVTVTVTDACSGCGLCIDKKICFVGAHVMENGKVRIDQSKCRGCGRCVEFCPSKAVEIRIDDPYFFEKSVDKIEQLVDLKAE
ncbi:MAG: 4Fe-4S binding protein [Thermoplasmata archaeon]